MVLALADASEQHWPFRGGGLSVLRAALAAAGAATGGVLTHEMVLNVSGLFFAGKA